MPIQQRGNEPAPGRKSRGIRWTDVLFYAAASLVLAAIGMRMLQIDGINGRLRAEIVRVRAEIPTENERLWMRSFGIRFPKLPTVSVEGSAPSGPVDGPRRRCWTLVIAFEITGCGSCGSEAPFWNQLATRFEDRLRVVAVAATSTSEQAAAFARANAMSIPVLADPDGSLLGREDLQPIFGQANLPIKVVLNDVGAVIFAEGASTPPGFEAAYSTFASRLDGLLPPCGGQ